MGSEGTQLRHVTIKSICVPQRRAVVAVVCSMSRAGLRRSRHARLTALSEFEGPAGGRKSHQQQKGKRHLMPCVPVGTKTKPVTPTAPPSAAACCHTVGQPWHHCHFCKVNCPHSAKRYRANLVQCHTSGPTQRACRQGRLTTCRW